MESGAQADAVVTLTAPQDDLVDEFYIPYVRPLGNLVIRFAQAEGALLALVTEFMAGKEDAAITELKAKDPARIRGLAENSGVSGFELTELLETLDSYWVAQAKRNRLMHDEWWVALDATVGTRGTPHKKGSQVVWGDPDVADVWGLAAAFKEHRSVFAANASTLRDQRLQQTNN